jgi:hypothetical protein
MRRLILLAAALAAGADWPGWRGPTGQGQTGEKDLPLTWSAKGDNVLWKAALPGAARQDQNQSSPAVCKGRVIITSSYWPDGDTKKFPEHHVACFGAADGKPLWDVTVKPGPWLLTDLRGGYTAPTPACDAEPNRT